MYGRSLRGNRETSALARAAVERGAAWGRRGRTRSDAEMQITAFITEPATVRQILGHLGEPTRSPRIAPARGPPLWEAVAAAPAADHDPRWDRSAQLLPQSEFDQRLAW